MSIVHIRINGREYDIACDDGQEAHLKGLADEVDNRIRTLTKSMVPKPGEPMALVLAAVTMVDELIENRREIAKIAAEVQRLAALVNEDKKLEQEDRMMEIENAMAVTLEEIALRIEKIAESIEVS